MELQQPSPQKEDDWSFLDTALDWEALLDEPILETVMEDAPLDVKPSPDSQQSQVMQRTSPRRSAAMQPTLWLRARRMLCNSV